MGWAKFHIEKLQAGQTVQFRPKGNSMRGRIENGQLVTIEPITDHGIVKIGDAVLCRVGGNEYVHLVKGVQTRKGVLHFLIGNAAGRINGWTPQKNVYGVCVKVEP